VNLTLQLQMRTGTDPAGASAAWFLSGSSTARWLEELARTGLAEPGTRLFVVPRSTADPSPAGLLVVPDSPGSARCAPLGLACQRIAHGLFVPLGAQLDPPVTAAELRQLCPWEVAFFHPSLGLSGHEPGSTLRVWDLLDRPEERTEAWNEARAGESALPPFQAIALLQPPSLDDLYGDAAKTIGGKPLTDLPPAPQEPKNDPASAASRRLKQLFAKNLANLTGWLARQGSGTQPGWIDRLEQWAGRQIRGAQEQLEQLRNKELHRLLHLLQNDPEAGLRHAIPMNQFRHRGTGVPGATLPEHGLDFNPGQLGGKPGDIWMVPQDLETQLRRLYREMAGRELRQGRHRRAAYIYGELLGDLLSAANALEQGGFFRGAAVLYEDHLQNVREAARCLAAGGLLSEAIERYEKLELWLETAELYERLGQADHARAAFQRVIDQRLAHGDVLGAARLVEERLQQPDAAVDLLFNAWPAAAQAAKCLQAALQLLGRLGRHDVALERLARLRRESIPQLQPLIIAIGSVAESYPDERVRHRAADLARVLIAKQLAQPGLSADTVAGVVGSLIKLAPEDRLLANDANRHVASWRAEYLHQQKISAPKAGQAPVALRRFLLPRPARWLEVRSFGVHFYALGHTPTQIKLVRGVWEGNCQCLSWPCAGHLIRQGVVLEVSGDQGRSVAVATNAGPMLDYKMFPASDLFVKPCRAGTPGWLSGIARPFALAYANAWAVHVATDEAILSCHDRDGALRHTIEITAELLQDAERCADAKVCLAIVGEGAAVALGNRLVIYHGNGLLTQLTLPDQVVRLHPTLPHTRLGVVIALEHGAILHWVGSRDWLEVDRDLPAPFCAFVPRGPLVLVSGSRGLILEVDRRGLCSAARFEPACRTPVGVVSMMSPGGFALFDAGGEVVVYQMPR